MKRYRPPRPEDGSLRPCPEPPETLVSFTPHGPLQDGLCCFLAKAEKQGIDANLVPNLEGKGGAEAACVTTAVACELHTAYALTR